jgi:hypothetical protein
MKLGITATLPSYYSSSQRLFEIGLLKHVSHGREFSLKGDVGEWWEPLATLWNRPWYKPVTTWENSISHTNGDMFQGGTDPTKFIPLHNWGGVVYSQGPCELTSTNYTIQEIQVTSEFGWTPTHPAARGQLDEACCIATCKWWATPNSYDHARANLTFKVKYLTFSQVPKKEPISLQPNQAEKGRKIMSARTGMTENLSLFLTP